MASVVNDPDGRKRIQFFGRDGRRQTVRLGVMTKKAAQGVCLRIEHLLQTQMSGQVLDPETGRWVSDLGDVLAERLAAVGLIPARESSRLGPCWTSTLRVEQTSSHPVERSWNRRRRSCSDISLPTRRCGRSRPTTPPTGGSR